MKKFRPSIREMNSREFPAIFARAPGDARFPINEECPDTSLRLGYYEKIYLFWSSCNQLFASFDLNIIYRKNMNKL